MVEGYNSPHRQSVLDTLDADNAFSLELSRQTDAVVNRHRYRSMKGATTQISLPSQRCLMH